MPPLATFPFVNFWVLSNLTNASFEDLHVRLSRLLYVYNFKHALLNAFIDEYVAYVNTFGVSIRGMGASPLTQRVARADKHRDKMMRRLRRQIKQGLDSPDPQVVAAAEVMQTIFNDYEKDAASQMGAQTEQIKGLLRNMTTDDYFDDAKKVGLLTILADLEQANEAFYTLYTERYNERGSRPEKAIDSREVRQLIIGSCRQIFQLINGIVAGINLGDETTEDKVKLEKLILEITALFDQYRQVNAMQGRKRPQNADEQIEEGVRDLIAAQHLEAEAQAQIKEGEQRKMADATARAEAILSQAREQIAEEEAPLAGEADCECGEER